MYLPRKKPEFDAPMESWTPKLVEQGVHGYSYNIVGYGDIYWAVHWAEGSFDPDAFFQGRATNPVVVGETIEELRHGLRIIHGDADAGAHQIDIGNTQINKLQPVTITKSSPAHAAGEQSSPNREDALSVFHEEAHNLLHFRDYYRKKLPQLLPNSPGLKNARIPLTNLFEAGDGEPIIIISPAPSRSCNYRCEYCFNHDHGFTKNDAAMDSWCKSIVTAAKRIPRPLHMSMGAMGEPLFMKKWLDTATNVLKHDNVKRLAFVSNLGIDPAKVISHLDPQRLGVLASLHPSEYKDYDKELSTFLDRVIYLHGLGVSIAVNYVLIPDQLERFRSFREQINKLGIQMICNVLRGPFRGKVYPESYSSEEHALAKSCHDNTPFIWDFQSHERNPYGVRCVSGRWGFQLEFDGTVYNCDFARQRLGSIFDPALMVRTDNCHCTARKCESQVMIGMIEDVARDYRMDGNMHTYTKRNSKGSNPLT
jgi:hypothetical protein